MKNSQDFRKQLFLFCFYFKFDIEIFCDFNIYFIMIVSFDIRSDNMHGYERGKIKPLECTLYVQMKPLWKFARFWGILPFLEIPETGTNSSRT